MSNIKKLKTRMIQKHGRFAEWNQSFVAPLDGEIIVYSDGAFALGNVPAIKVGDGVSIPAELPCVGDFVYPLGGVATVTPGEEATIGYINDRSIRFNIKDTNTYHTPLHSSGLKLATGTGLSDLYIPITGNDSVGVVRGFHHTSGTATGTKTGNATNSPAINARTTTTGRYYGVETDSRGAMYVNVPWTNTNTDTTYTAGTGLTLNGTTFNANVNATVQTKPANPVTSTYSRTYAVQVDSDDNLVVNVPWIYSCPTSGITVCSTLAGTAAKTASITNFSLVSGQYIMLRVLTTNTATRSSVTLNIGGTGARSVKVEGSTSNQLVAGDYLATVDGNYWNLTRIYLTDNNQYHTPKFTTGLNIGDGDANLASLYVPYATPSQYGVVKPSAVRKSAITATTTGGTTSSRYYGVELDNDGKMFVNVPWQNDYHLSKYTDGLLITAGNSNISNLCVPYATPSQYGVVKPASVRKTAPTLTVGKTETSRYYGVELDNDGKMFVNVPWTDCHDMSLDVRNRDSGSPVRGSVSVQLYLATSEKSNYSDKGSKVLATPDLLIKYIVGERVTSNQWKGIKSINEILSYTKEAIDSMLLGNAQSSGDCAYSGVAPCRFQGNCHLPVSAYILESPSVNSGFYRMFSYSGQTTPSRIGIGSISTFKNVDGHIVCQCMLKDTYFTSSGTKQVPVTHVGIRNLDVPTTSSSLPLTPGSTYTHTDT